MPSPAVTAYYSTDISAPVLSGTVNSLIGLLHSCLVTGYGSKTGAGWTKPFSGTNNAVFQAGGGNGRFLQVFDNAEATGGAKEARTFGFETMSGMLSGINPFPTTTQSVNGITIRKSNTADATARAWVLIATDATFYLFVATGDYTGSHGFGFGDFTSYKTGGDAYGTFIIGKQIENDATPANERLGHAGNMVSQAAITGHYVCRNYTGVGSSINVGKFIDGSKTLLTSNTLGSNQFILYPNAPDGGLWMCPVWINQAVSGNYVLRGHLPGLWCPLHTVPLNHLDTFSGTGALAGRTFQAISIPNAGQLLIETSSTWA
ncbi:MAG: hypothetical protein HQL99_13370 [Magnetococcales bacterium]|nr:hypothetical protein [Magnetococcales bacterium]